MTAWLIILPLWWLCFLVWWLGTAKDRREKRRCRKQNSHCPCYYLGFEDDDWPYLEGAGPYQCLCPCADERCACGCRGPRGCYQDLVMAGFRE